MRELYEKLLKILRLEQSRGWNDSAVIGGLEGFLAFWLAEARERAPDTPERRRVNEAGERLLGYGKMTPEERARQGLYLLERYSPAPDQRVGAAPTPFPGTIEPEAHAPTFTPPASEPQPTVPGPRAAALPSPSWEEPAASRRREGKRERGRGPSKRRTWPPEEALSLDRALDHPVTTLAGIGSAKADKLARLGIGTVRDLLWHAPFRYEDFTALRTISELVLGDEVTVVGVVQDMDAFKSPRGTVVVNGIVSDGTGTLRLRWFGNRFLINQLRPGTMVRLSGRIEAHLGRLLLNGPRWEALTEEEVRGGRLVPVYPRTEGLSEKALAGDIARALEATAGRIPDPLPPDLRDQYDLPELGQAVRWLHQAETMEQAETARHRLAFDELLRLQLGMLQQRRAWKAQPGFGIEAEAHALNRFYETLPFQLTSAQQCAIEEILRDLTTPEAMSRLLQGDVGSGKTVVAAVGLLAAVSAGYQGALMAPTEILAEQHFAGLTRLLNPEGEPLLGDRPVRVALLTGSLPVADKQRTRAAVAAGEVDVVIGTHALLQEGVEFDHLGLVIVDEQHRFGVQQRGMLRHRTAQGTPDLLVMSATPIPRTLALTLYGDLDLTVMDEMPPGRLPIVTRAIAAHQRERAYTYIRRQVLEGRQAFIICPLVEESDKLEARAAVEEHRFLQSEVFPDFQVELLHGRMRADEKEAAMGRFYRNESQILVSTSVVEVGIDVPNASVMLIEGANRFGLAQLHQFRGRIGRGPHRSLCLLMAEESLSSEGEQRLNALVENSDGFALAEEDLRMRGPGDFFGTRQSGLPELHLARLGDARPLTEARDAATLLLDRDSTLAQPEHQLLKAQTDRYWAAKRGELS